MDTERAIEMLEEFAELTTAYHVAASTTGGARGGRWWEVEEVQEVEREIRRRLLAAQRLIVAAAGKSAGDQMMLMGKTFDVYKAAREMAEIAAGAIRHASVVDEILEPGPTVAAARLHHWIWEAARPVWADGHRRASIQSAAARLDVETQTKLERWDIRTNGFIPLSCVTV